MLLLKFFLVALLSLLAVAFLTLLERKLLGIVGSRLGPTKVSTYGILQPIGDALKLGNKQASLSMNFSSFSYYLSSVMMLFSSLLLWTCFFSDPLPLMFSYPLLVFVLVLSISSLNSIASGWGSFSKFPLLGSMRSVAQLVSYESCLYMCLFFILLLFLSFSMDSYKNLGWLFAIVPSCFLCWLPSSLAELNRTPYDFSEGESELVSGFNTEYGSNTFTLIFLSEYSNMLFFSLLTSLLFFSTSVIFFSFLFVFLILWIRSVLPRYRFDKLMMLAWKFLIPFLTCFFFCFCLYL